MKKNHSLHNLLHLFGYTYCYWHLQLEGNGGHNGVAAFCRISPICVLQGFIHPTASIDDSKQGRVLTLFFPGFSIIHTYVPCSSMPPHPEVPCNPHAPDKDKFRQLFDSNLHDHLRHVRDYHPVRTCRRCRLLSNSCRNLSLSGACGLHGTSGWGGIDEQGT